MFKSLITSLLFIGFFPVLSGAWQLAPTGVTQTIAPPPGTLGEHIQYESNKALMLVIMEGNPEDSYVKLQDAKYTRDIKVGDYCYPTDLTNGNQYTSYFARLKPIEPSVTYRGQTGLGKPGAIFTRRWSDFDTANANGTCAVKFLNGNDADFFLHKVVEYQIRPINGNGYSFPSFTGFTTGNTNYILP